jgi:hypothetical protein
LSLDVDLTPIIEARIKIKANKYFILYYKHIKIKQIIKMFICFVFDIS